MFWAVIMGMSMNLCGIASAGDNQTQDFYFELRARGKGYEYTMDNATAKNSVYIESEHKLPKKIIFYAWADRTKKWQNVVIAYYNTADNETGWKASNYDAADNETGSNGSAQATDQGLTMNLGNPTIYITEDDIKIDARAVLIAQFKENDDGELKIKVKSLGAYYEGFDGDDPEANPPKWDQRQIRGTLKVRGKLIDWDDLPEEVQKVFTAM